MLLRKHIDEGGALKFSDTTPQLNWALNDLAFLRLSTVTEPIIFFIILVLSLDTLHAMHSRLSFLPIQSTDTFITSHNDIKLKPQPELPPSSSACVSLLRFDQFRLRSPPITHVPARSCITASRHSFKFYFLYWTDSGHPILFLTKKI